MKQMSVPTRARRAPRIYSLDHVFNWLVEYKSAHDGNSPAMREMMRAFDISNTSVANNLLNRLVRAGRIRRAGKIGAARSIEVIGGQWTMKQTFDGALDV